MNAQNTQKSGDRTAMRAFLDKVVVNAGVGRASQMPSFEDKILPGIIKDIANLSGQKPQIRRARKSIAGFKIREGQIVGVRATLRGMRAVDFLERMNRIVLPRVRDFNGLPLSAVDSGGSLNVGLKEQYVFSEINPEESLFSFPLQVTFVPRKKDREAALAALKSFGTPLAKQK